MRLVAWTLGHGFEEAIAQVENIIMEHTGECLGRPVDPARVRAWLEHGDAGPEEMALALEGRHLAGYSWAWVNVDEGPASLAWIMLRVNPLLDPDSQARAARLLLAWARHSLEQWQEARGVARVRLGLLGGYTYRLVGDLVGGVEAYRVSGVLMEAWRPVEATRPGLDIREARPWESSEDLNTVVHLYNDAFSVYESYRRWRVEDARSYFNRVRRELRPLVLVAEDGEEPAGFVEAYTYESICGSRVGYIALLAVARGKQGRGIGSTLLSMAARWLQGQGVDRVVLDAVPEALGLYIRRGFRPVRIYVESSMPIYTLPQGVYTMEPGG